MENTPPAASPPPDIGTIVAQLAPYLLETIQSQGDRRGRERAWRTYAFLLMVGGKSWEEARSLALEILYMEDVAGSPGTTESFLGDSLP